MVKKVARRSAGEMGEESALKAHSLHPLPATFGPRASSFGFIQASEK